jgi:NADH:ubiquinone oxidoreductase subunit K
MRYHYPAMKNSNKWPKPLGGPPKKPLDEDDGRPDAPVYGPLFPRPVFVGLLVVFCVSLMLTADWFGLLLLNPRVSDRIGTLNTVRVMAVLMTGIAVPSALLMLHYKRLYSYVSEHNVFFAITFSLSFMLGLPCALVGVFG